MVNGGGFRSGLIVEADEPFRAELYNFLLLVGFHRVVSKENLTAAWVDLEKRPQLYDAVLVDLESLCLEEIECIENLARSCPATSFVLLMEAEDRDRWEKKLETVHTAKVVFKDNFDRDLLTLLA